MSYRITLEVRWKAEPEPGQWAIERQGTGVALAYAPTKAEAISRGAEEGRALKAQWLLAELVPYRLDGRIGKGGSGRRTYGKDPKGHKG